MNIIVIGAGNVGSTVAGALSSSHNIMMIESQTQKTEALRSVFNVSVLQENGVNPRVIREAIERHSADVLIGAMPADENNLFACMVAKNFKPGIRTLAKVRDPDFIMHNDNGEVFGADQIVSPELSAAKKLAKLAVIENAVDYEEAESIGLAMAVFHVNASHKDIAEKNAINIPMPGDCTIAAVYRKDEIHVCSETTMIHGGDMLCVFGTPAAIVDFNRMMGYPRESKEIMIIGGGIIGSNIAKILEKEKKYVKLIENDAERCKKIARETDNVLVVNADGIDPNILRSENAGRADAIICATDSDEKNLLGCLVSRDLGAQKVISRYSQREYEDVFGVTGIKTIVGYHRLIANEITKALVPDEKAVMKMGHEEETLFSVTLTKSSKANGVPAGDLRFPDGTRAICIIRNGKIIFPESDAKLEENDALLIYTCGTKMNRIGKMLGMRIADV